MQLFSRRIIIDQHGKATNFRLHSLQYPHMRALHFSWLSFMVAFMAWYAVPPVVYHMSEELKLDSMEIYDSNMAAVALTIVARLAAGPLCERYGPRRVMSCILIVGAIPCGFTGFITNGTGLIVNRAFVGVLGSTFVPSQFWTTQMFAPSVLGTANAIAAGWGNLGGGITYLLMPAVYDIIHSFASNGIAWRISFLVPTFICLVVACTDYFCATDTPHGDWFKVRQTSELSARTESASTAHSIEFGDEKDGLSKVELAEVDGESLDEVDRNESIFTVVAGFFRVLCNPNVFIIFIHYAFSFGTELAIDNVIGQVFREKFDLDNSTASYIGSIFGMLNVFSRISGGIFSDFFAERFHIPGRILAHMVLMFWEAVFLLAFSFSLTDIKTSILILVCFSFFVQAVCGSTFGIVPFIDPLNNGKVMGLIGAGGNVGGLTLSLLFRQYNHNFESAFLCLGLMTLGVGIIGNALLRVQGQTIWHMFNGQYNS